MRVSIRFWLLVACLNATCAHAEWKAANPDVESAAREASIAAVLDTVNKMDAAVVNDDHATFTALLDNDLAVNNPQNSVSVRGATANRGSAGLISYSRYDRSIEYVGLRGDLVVLMGEETVVPKGNNPHAGTPVRRRFTDLWRPTAQGWKLTVRQATIIAPM